MTAPNPMVGEAEFRGLRLRMDFDRWCALEGLTRKKMPALCAEFEMGLGLVDLKVWFRCFAEGEVTDQQLTAALHQGGMMADYEAATGVLGELMRGFFNPPRDDTADPPKAE